MYSYNTRIWESTNGCRTIYEKMECTNNISYIIICCQVGSMHETTETEGFAHLLEHILMTSDTNHISYTQTFQRFNVMGIEFNAYTTKSSTSFSIKCLTSFVPKIIDILANIMFYSNILTRDPIIEQKVIYYENQSDEKESINKADNIFKDTVYHNTPYEKPVDKKRVVNDNISPNLLQKFYETYYVPKNFVISIISDVPYQTIESHIEQSLFSKIPSVGGKKTRKTSYSMNNSGIHISRENTNTCTVVAGFCIQNITSIEKYTLEFLKYHLNRLDGILFQHIRMQEGIAYQFFSEFELEEIGGCFSIVVETSHINIEHLITFMMSVFKNLKHVKLHEDTISQVKQHIKHQLRMKYHDFETVAEYNIQQVVNHNLIPHQYLYDICYKSINSTHIQTCANKYFTMPNVIVSIVTNEHVVQSTIEHICKTSL
jgi:predicted Zn-dependent peptidase